MIRITGMNKKEGILKSRQWGRRVRGHMLIQLTEV